MKEITLQRVFRSVLGVGGESNQQDESGASIRFNRWPFWMDRCQWFFQLFPLVSLANYTWTVLPAESLFCLRRGWKHSLGFQSCIQTKISGSISFGKTRPKWRCLSIMYSLTFGVSQTQHVSTNITYQLSKCMVVEGCWGRFPAIEPGHWVDH